MKFPVPKRKVSKKAAPNKKFAIRGKVARAFTFDKLVSTISGIHESLANQAAKAVNISLTLRNWLIGFYIAEYELHGTDRASYGDQIIDRLSMELQKSSMPRCDRRELYRYRQLYCIYPQIVETVPPQFASDENTVKIQRDTVMETVSPQFISSFESKSSWYERSVQ